MIVILVVLVAVLLCAKKIVALVQVSKLKNCQKFALKELPEVPLLGIIKTNLKHRFSLVKLFTYFASVNPAVMLKSCGVRFAIINDTRLAKECLQSPGFSGKASSEGYCFHSQGEYGLLNTHGKKWEEQRKFCLRQLSNFGFGKRSMESLIQNEIDEFLKVLRKQTETKICPNRLFYLPVVNSIWMILASDRIGDQNSKVYTLALEVFEDVAKAFKAPECFLLLLPLKLETLSTIAHWLPFSYGWKRLRKNVLKLRAYLQELIESRTQGQLNSHNHNDENSPSDFIDAFQFEVRKATDENSVFFGENGAMNLLGVLTEFFIAGGDTTANMIAWCVLHLVRNPGIQREIQTEIDCAVGRDRRPGLSDRINCPFTEAFIWEVLRFNPVTITTTPRTITEDKSIGPYSISKGSAVILNIIGIHNDPKVWGDPENFRPQRFLSPDGKMFVKNENMVAFSIGKRKCPGEQLAKDNMFLFVTAICHTFNIDNGGTSGSELDLRPLYNGGFLVPKKFNVVLTERLE